MNVNEVIELLLNHRSIRKFTNQKLTEQQVQLIIQAAQMASTSSHVMAYTIIGITDEALKEKLYEISKQSYVKENGHLFIFCADLHRNSQLNGMEKNSTAITNLQSTEQFIVATVDASLAAQNACIAAESLGLGICYIGSLRNDIVALDKLLTLPEYVIPLFGLVVGYPDHTPDKKPRLPLNVVYHENGYLPFDKQREAIETFDSQMEEYYRQRSSNVKLMNWSNQVTQKYSKPTRLDVSPYIQSKNLNIK